VLCSGLGLTLLAAPGYVGAVTQPGGPPVVARRLDQPTTAALGTGPRALLVRPDGVPQFP
jgi:hypothetical protein